MNKFYTQPKLLQWIEAILLLIVGFYPAILIIEWGHSQPLFYGLFFIYLPVGQFITTPIFTLSGIYSYYSPMLLGYMSNKSQIDLHSGTSFDYLFVMSKCKAGFQFRNRILTYHLEGLLHIISQIEKNVVPTTVKISGTSYFFSERTLHKIGFELEETTLFYRINLLANAIDLLWMYSVSQGKLSMPKLWSAKNASIEGGKLIESKEIIIDLHKKLTVKKKTTT